MYNELKTLMQDRGKKKKNKGQKESGKVVVEGETKETTPEGTSNRSKGYVIEKGPDGKERRSRFEASSTEPPARPGTSSGPAIEGGRSKGYMMEKDSEGKMRKSEFEASSSPIPEPPKGKTMVGSGPITPEEFEKIKAQKGDIKKKIMLKKNK